MSKKEPCPCLNESQVETNLKNICQLMRLKGSIKKRLSGPLKVSQEDVSKYHLNAIAPKDRAESYSLYEVPGEFYFIVIYAHEFQVKNFLACDYFNHLIDEYARKDVERPLVYLCHAHDLQQAEIDKIPIGLLDCPYRLVSLAKLHPITGSPNGLEGFVKDYKLLKGEKAISFNNKHYPFVLSNDPAVKLVNALPGEIIRAKQMYCDKGCAYYEYKIREVKRSKTSLGQFDDSGIDNFDV